MISGIIFWIIAPNTEECEDGTIIKSSNLASFWFIGLKVWTIIAFIAGMYIIIKNLIVRDNYIYDLLFTKLHLKIKEFYEF